MKLGDSLASLQKHAVQATRGRGGIASTHSWSPHQMGWVVSVSAWPCFIPWERTLPVPTGQEAVWASELVWAQTSIRKKLRENVERLWDFRLDYSLWDIASCSLFAVDWRFRGAYCFIIGAISGGRTHLWNIGILQQDFTALSSRRQ
jgi:hypothetical protein